MGNQSIALQARTFDPVSALTQVSQLDSQNLANQYNRDTLGDREALTGAQSQLEQASADNAKATVAPTKQASERMQVANAMALAQTSVERDKALQDLADNGVTLAQQYIGRGGDASDDQVRNWVNALSAQGPSSALSATNGGVDPNAGAPGTAQNADLTQRYRSMSPGDLAKTRDHLTKIQTAVAAVDKATDKQAAWRQQAVALGFPQMANDPNWQTRFTQIKQQTIAATNALGSLDLENNIGIPAAPHVAVERVGNALVKVDTTNPGNPTTSPLYQGQYKPTAFMDRQNAYLAVHPGDSQGALEYASGKAGSPAAKNMTPAAIEKYAETQSAKELNDARLNGDAVGDPAQWQQSRKAEIIQNLSKANAQGAPGAAPGATDTPAAPGFTPAQRSYEKQFPPNPKARDGDRTKPFFVKTYAEVQAIKKSHPGAYVVGPSGQLKGPL